MTHSPTFGTDSSDLGEFNNLNVNSVNAFPAPDIDGFVKLPNLSKYVVTTSKLNTGTLKFIPETPGAIVEIRAKNLLANTLTTNLENGDPLFSGDFGILTLDIDIISSTGTAALFDTDSITFPAGTGAVVITGDIAKNISNFQSIGTIKGASAVFSLVQFVDCGAGLVVDNPVSAVIMNQVNFPGQSGTHITVLNDSALLFFTQISAQPKNGDRVFDLDNVNNTTTRFGLLGIDTSLGGTTGLEETVDSDTQLGTVFPFINVDTTNNPVELIMPDAAGVGILNTTIRGITDLGNAATNNITILPFATDGTQIDGLPSFTMDKNNQVVLFELIDGQWLEIGNTDEYAAFGAMGYSDNATDTVIDFADTYVDIGGTIGVGDLRRFIFSTNELEYTGWKTDEFRISVNFSLKKALGASAREIRAALFIDTGSGFVEQGSAPMDMDNNLKSFGFVSIRELSTGDKLKMEIKNITNDDDILIVTYDLVVTKV